MDFNPYAAPAASDGAQPSAIDSVTGLRDLPPFVSAHGRAIFLIGLFGANIVCAAADVFAQLTRAIDAEEITIADLPGVAQLFVTLLCALVFLMWGYRAHRNFPALGADRLEFSSAGVIGWWFVPFLNLVKPYHVVREIWLASNPDFVGDKPWRWRTGPKSSLILAWWLCFLASGFVTRASMGLPEDANIQVLSDLTDIVAALLAIAVVRAIDRRQAEAYEKLCGLIDRPAWGGAATLPSSPLQARI